jgi:hypothetical protein
MANDFPHELLAALVYIRFNCDHEQARAAWTRMLQNPGWDDNAVARTQWHEMVGDGIRVLRSCGFRNLTDLRTNRANRRT